MSVSTSKKIRAALKSLPDGTYSVPQLTELFRKNEIINWTTSWALVKSMLVGASEWHWNGEKHSSKSRWIKETMPVAKPKPMLAEPTPCPVVAIEGKGPVSAALGRMEAMLERLCSEWKIPTDNLPVQHNDEKLKTTMTALIGILERWRKQTNPYIRRPEVESALSMAKHSLKP